MRGKKKAPKRKINPDIKYSNVQVAKFINYLMNRGKKTTAQTVLYDAFDIISEKTKKNSSTGEKDVSLIFGFGLSHRTDHIC